MTESTFQTYIGEETLTHDNSAKFNSENENANENEKEYDDEFLYIEEARFLMWRNQPTAISTQQNK